MDVSLGLAAPHLCISRRHILTRRHMRCSSPTVRHPSSRNMWRCTKTLYLAPALQKTRHQPLSCPAAEASVLHAVRRRPGGNSVGRIIGGVADVDDERASRRSARPPSATVPRASRREQIPCDNVGGSGVSDSLQQQMPRHLTRLGFAASRSLEGRSRPRAATIC